MKVVRCPGCRGASRVAPEAIGHSVACPRCHEAFVAIEEATPFVPASPPPPAPPKPRLRPRRTPADDRPRRPTAEPVGPPSDPHAVHHHAHHAEPAGKLPATVLIGLALLPFIVPLLWTIAPFVVGQPPVLSLATPIALAVGASALCLAVVYTIDWSPITRVKGVLILVGLSYFAGLSLYFLKKEMVDKAREFVGEERNWDMFQPPGGDYRVRMPPNRIPADNLRPLPAWELKCFKATHKSLLGPTVYTVGMAADQTPARAGDEEEWFAAVEKSLRAAVRGEMTSRPLLPVPGTGPGREFKYQFGQQTSVVRVYRAKGRLYYLSAAGPNVDPDDTPTSVFFESFIVLKE